MVVVISSLIGAILGGYQAKRRDGNTKDIAQYAAVYALIFGVVGLFVAIFIDRTLG